MGKMWTYQGQEFTEVPEGIVGFVYIIENNTTGKRYIGKKLFTMAKTKQVKGKRKRFRAPSNWKEYYGSSTELQDDVILFGAEHFTRTILHLCTTKGWCSYLEAKEQMLYEVLEHPDHFYNQQVRCRVHRSHLKLES
jgi:hypothetical protein